MRAPIFDCNSREDVSNLLGVRLSEINHVISRHKHYYMPRDFPKPDGTCRKLLVPRGRLKEIQSEIKTRILSTISWPTSVHGGVLKRSNRTNALPHVGKSAVYSLDIKSFFPSVPPSAVNAAFKRLGFTEAAAKLLTRLTTWEHQLPQGAPTSTGLANLVLDRLDARFSSLCHEHGFDYTRFVDDITFSGGYRILKFRKLLIRILEDEGYEVKLCKVETMLRGSRQVVTKLIVNRKLNLPREKRKKIRREVLDLAAGRGAVTQANSVRGKAAWLAYINPEVGEPLVHRIKHSESA